MLDNLPKSITMGELVPLMKNCPQTREQSVYQHGVSVFQNFLTILHVITGAKKPPDKWRIPDFCYKHDIHTSAHLPDIDIMREYLIFHDCGKPFVRMIDEEGRQHFPNHAQASKHIWLLADGSKRAANLMAMDMDAHLLRADGIQEFSSRPEAFTLMMAAVAEVHSNAAMFGGFDGDSFKIKIKRLAKNGKTMFS